MCDQHFLDIIQNLEISEIQVANKMSHLEEAIKTIRREAKTFSKQVMTDDGSANEG